MKYNVNFDLEFRKHNYSGLFFALEGIDGSGKTTQTEQVAKLLEQRGKNVITTGEPTNKGVIGELIRNVLQSKADVPAVSLQYLFAADRAVHQEQTTIPNLKEGKIVVSDRCFWSAVPYGLADKESVDYANGESLLVAYGLLSMYNQFIAPNLTFYLDISVDTAIMRLSQMDKVKEIYEKKEKLEKIYNGYQFLIKKFPEEFVVIDGEQSEEKITEEIISKIE